MSRELIAGAVLGAGLVVGGMLIQGASGREASAAPGSARLLDQVIARVQHNYLDSVPTDELYRRAATGLVREVDDPYSVMLTPERYKRLRETTSGRYPGVGVELDLRDGFVTIIAPIAGTPADSAGIAPGDRIVGIDGKPTIGLGMEEVQQALRGANGTLVRLSILRGESVTRAFTLRRTQIVYHPVQRATVAVGGIGYVELATFSETAASELQKTIDSLRQRGARSLILDLRENPGGLLEQGIAVADLFLNEGQVIASTRGRTSDADEDFRDEAPQRWPDMPIVALIDSGSASATEIVAGALQDYGRAVLVGSPTYGKGSAQSIFPLQGGRALKLTTARWFTPDGRTIERDSTSGGISPDIIARMTAGTVRMESHAPTAEGLPQASTDPAMARAFQLLDGVTTVAELRKRVPAKR